MGLFDKKKKGRDDFDSPVERIDVNAADATSMPTGTDDADIEIVSGTPSPAAASASGPARSGPTAAATAASAAPAESPAALKPRKPAAAITSYGIDDAIALMRTLPQDNVELVVQVVKHTLQSAHIDITSIIEDATSKQERLSARVAVLRDAIADLEREIAVRKTEIEQLEADNKETTKVKERLVLAEKLTEKASRKPEPAAPPAAAPLASARGYRPTGDYGRARASGVHAATAAPSADESGATPRASGGTAPPPVASDAPSTPSTVGPSK